MRRSIGAHKAILDRHQPLDMLTERRLVARAQKGDASARNALVLHNMRLVADMVLRGMPRHVPVDDLMQEGALGLMRAVDMFDASAGTRFATFAAWKVRERLIEAAYAHDLVAVPKYFRLLVAQARRAAANFNGDATVDAVARAIDVGRYSDDVYRDAAFRALHPIKSVALDKEM